MSEDDVSPSAAYAALGDETRIAIIRELGDDGPHTFSELRERVGVSDSGRFNYHLGKLVGSFVRRSEGGGYELTYAGSRVVGAVLAGEYGRHGEARQFTLDASCLDCETPLEAAYEAETVTIRCPHCEELQSRFGFPPGAFDGRTREELVDAFDRHLKHVVRGLADGICGNCFGTVDGRLSTETTSDSEPVEVAFSCDRCPEGATLSVNAFLLFHPAAVAHYYDHGVDLFSTHFWRLEFVVTESATVRSEDPLRVSSVLDLDGDALEFVIAEDLSVAVDPVDADGADGHSTEATADDPPA